jgi:AcrR family transcriptional regulator
LSIPARWQRVKEGPEEDTTAKPTGAQRQARSRNSAARERILAATSELIARHGINGLRFEEVADQASVSRALLYYHFGNRTGLVNAAFEYASEQAPSTILRTTSEGRSGFDSLVEGLLAELEEDPAVRDHAVVWGEVGAAAVFDEELRPGMRRVTRRWATTVQEAIERGIADGSIRNDLDPKAAAQLLVILVDGLGIWWLAGSLELEETRDLLRSALDQLRPGAAGS